jgi:hypothetical protein
VCASLLSNIDCFSSQQHRLLFGFNTFSATSIARVILTLILFGFTRPQQHRLLFGFARSQQRRLLFGFNAFSIGFNMFSIGFNTLFLFSNRLLLSVFQHPFPAVSFPGGCWFSAFALL